MIKKLFRNVLRIESFDIQILISRHFSCSSIYSKKYKYAIDLKKQKTSGTTNFQYKKGPSIVDGKALTYFKFKDEIDDYHSHDQFSPKRLAYADIVKDSVVCLLSSKESPKEIQDIAIDIVNVEVSSGLTSAFLYWRISKDFDSKYSKDKTASILEKYLPVLRADLPAYSTVTQTPVISFVYDNSTEREEEINKLFDLVRQEF